MHADHADALRVASQELGERASVDVPLGPMTTYRVGGAADLFVRASDVADLTAVAHAATASGLPLLIVGRGSNLLVSDEGFRGIAVSLGDLAMCSAIDVDAAACTVDAGSAVLLPVLARKLAGIGLAGFEWAVGVPGSIGGAVRMNAGGHGSDMSESLVSISVFDFGVAALETRAASGLGLRFRGSGIGPNVAVLSAHLQLREGDPDASQAELGDIVSWRRANQPGGQNAGSVFVNPVPGEVSAGALIDDLGMRGLRLGSATVSEKHANFIQADDGGAAADVHALMTVVRDRVAEATGYVLRSEIRLIGFPDDGSLR